MAELALINIGELTTNVGGVVTNATVLVEDGLIGYAGSAGDAPEEGKTIVDCGDMAVLPGFVDAHTHLIFAGDRSDEFRRRLEGESYETIAASGGGILSTVTATRAATEDELFSLASARTWRMIRTGTTTIEIKSGYGLDLETELKLLRVARRLGAELPITVKTTFLGAHSVPPEYQGDADSYTQKVIEMVPEVADLADYCDVFVEQGVFDVDQARAVLEVANKHDLPARIHAEQLTHSGGAELAAELGAASADHLDHVTSRDADLLAGAGVSAVLVPGASFSLRSPQAPGPMLLAAGCNVALATDCNPGTSYFESMAPVIALGVIQMGLTVEEAIFAATAGGARSLGLGGVGVLGVGSPADLVVLDAPSVAHLPYRPATNHVSQVFKSGKRVA